MTDETPVGRHGRGSEGDDEPGTDERTVRTPRTGGDPEGRPDAGATSTTSSSGPDEPETSGDAEPGDDPTLVEGQARGRVRYQDPDTTTPREPTVAEQRARREAEKRREAQEAASAAAEERRRKNRKRLLVGGGVAVGIVAVVAIAYAASSDDGDEVDARCTDNQTGQVVPDDQCGQQQGGYYEGGHFVPLFIPFGGFGGRQYHYTYGSNSPVGTIARGGSTAPPASGTTLRGSSGTIGPATGNGSVSRGGLGVGSGSKGSSGSGSSGGSSGS